MKTCKWPLGNGKSLEFGVFTFNTDRNSVPGLYIFTYTDGQWWHALYIGQTEDFANRLLNHERRDEAIRKGATHIYAVVVRGATERDTFEELLIKQHNPPMNKQNKD